MSPRSKDEARGGQEVILRDGGGRAVYMCPSRKAETREDLEGWRRESRGEWVEEEAVQGLTR